MEPRFRILGPIDVRGADRVPRGRTLSLLALLLVHRGAFVHVDRALDELWEDARPTNGRKAVHVVASRLRSALGEGALRSEGGGYALRMAPGDLDADQFEELVGAGRAELAAGEAWEAAGTLRRALELWHGPALADVAHARFAQPEIARLEDLRLACVSDRIDADLDCGRHAEVAGELEALVREHPLRERLRGQQMLALYRTGRQAEALEAYRSAYAALVDGLGIEPSPDLRELESAILRHEVPAQRAPAPSGPLPADARRLVTCVFAWLEPANDDAESLRAVLEGFHDAAVATCTEHGGTVVESRTDAVLAVFGAPVAHEDAAQRGLRAAAELVGLQARCGVATGEVVAAARRATATVIGEPVGAAERLGRAAARGEIRLDPRTWSIVHHAARATALRDGGFRLDGFDPDAPAIGRRLDRPLVGREPELERLREAFARVEAARAARLLAVVGEPGIGKSRLVAELDAVVGARGTVLIGRCPAYGRGMTYAPLRAVVEEARGDRSIDELGAALGVPPSAARQVAVAVGLREGRVGEDTGWAFLRVIEGLARSRPLVLVVDDAHLAEPALLEMLGDVAARLRGAPALIVWVARRDALDERHPGWAERVDELLELGPLSPAAAATLVEEIDEGRLEPAQRERIAAAAGGNPLFLEQLVAYLEERDAPSEALPPALHALLASRLDRLEAAERSVLALGAVVGDAFETREVSALAEGMSRVELERACERLVMRDLLEQGDDGPLRFRHGLVREAAYASLAKTARARLHERHAASLERLGADLPEADARIGLHLEAACRYERDIAGAIPAALASAAGERLADAAFVARTRGDLPGEIGFLERAVAVLGPDRAERAELMPTLSAALIEAGDSARAEEFARQAVAASIALALPGAEARAAIERERVRLYRNPESFDVRAAMAVVDHSSRVLRARGDALGQVRVDYLMADLTWLLGDAVATYSHSKRMLDHARRAHSGVDIATALLFMTWCLVQGPCPVPESIDRFDALGAEGSDLRAVELTAMGCRAGLVAMTGRYEDAGAAMADTLAGLAEMQLSAISVYMAFLACVVALLAGDPGAAERILRDARTLVVDPEDRWYLSMIDADLTHVLLAQGRVSDAVATIAEMDARPISCDAEWVIRRHIARALVAARAGTPEAGLEDADAAVAGADRTGLIVTRAEAHRARAEVLAAIGHTEEAARAARRALRLYEAKAHTIAAASTRAEFAELLAASPPALSP
ncbi:MAG TPA: BTAD domain-containing putative transcriptional regulator [Solirubrobacteraceae bacterium]|nr:BTAD domain-containing putative transcriptional regulator [Solirubrobacteraceae bacterium]